MKSNTLSLLGLVLIAVIGCHSTKAQTAQQDNNSTNSTDSSTEDNAYNPDKHKYKYKVRGKYYSVLKSADNFEQTGIASWYGAKFHGKKTASGQRFNMYAMTAAHKTLPLGTKVEVTNLNNNKKITVRINDRGPFHRGRIIDLSRVAAKKLGIIKSGHTKVQIKSID